MDEWREGGVEEEGERKKDRVEGERKRDRGEGERKREESEVWREREGAREHVMSSATNR